MLMKTKEFYTSPEVDVLVVQPEGVICTSNSNSAPKFNGYDDESWD